MLTAHNSTGRMRRRAVVLGAGFQSMMTLKVCASLLSQLNLSKARKDWRHYTDISVVADCVSERKHTLSQDLPIKSQSFESDHAHAHPIHS